jgi:NADPH2:quinone reductase
MLAIQMDQTGGPEVLTPKTLPDLVAGPGQVLVRHKAIGLNFIETYQRRGIYPVKLPAVLGQEAAGVVAAVGDGVTRVKVGDRVAYAHGSSGSYAEMAVVGEERAVVLPDAISFETAAAVMLKGLTVEMLAARLFPLKPGHTTLVHAAAGAAGGLLVQWAKAAGATVIATAGSPQKQAIAKAHGADHVLTYDEPHWAEKARAVTGGRGVDVVYDGVGKTTFEGSLQSLAKRGWMVIYGAASGPAPQVDPLTLMRGGSLILTRPTLFDYIGDAAELDAAAKDLFAMIASGKVQPEVGQRFALKDAADAHRALEGRTTTGSTLLIP